MYRQHRCAAFFGEPHEAIRPRRVAHTLRSDARHFARRENDDRLIFFERAIGRTHASARGTFAAENIHRQQKIRQLRELHQEIVAENAHVAPHRADQMQQRHRIERAERMIGDDDESTFRRNVFAIGIGQAIRDLKIFQHALDEIESRQSADFLEHAPKCVFARDLAQQFDHRLRERARTAECQIRKPFVETALDADHARVPQNDSGRLTAHCYEFCTASNSQSPFANTARRHRGTSAQRARSAAFPSAAPAR